jgi:hypothetical protein
MAGTLVFGVRLPVISNFARGLRGVGFGRRRFCCSANYPSWSYKPPEADRRHGREQCGELGPLRQQRVIAQEALQRHAITNHGLPPRPFVEKKKPDFSYSDT